MKMLLFTFGMSLSLFTQGQTLIFSENVGTPGATTVISAYSGWQNAYPVDFSSTSIPESEVRATLNSAGYIGASGGGNIFFTDVSGRDLVISGINTTGYSGLTLSFGHYKNTISGSNELLVEVSEDGITYSSLAYNRQTGSGTANWLLINPSGAIPRTPNLHIRFRQTSTTTQFRIDDISLTGTSVLPVRLSGFRAYRSGEAIKLEWKNLTEKDVVNYTIERSGGDTNFNSIGTRTAIRNDGGEASYSWLDPHPHPGMNYYRIRSLETNGKILYSLVLRVDKKGGQISVYPNPLMGSTLTLQAGLPGGSYPLEISNAAGQVIFRRTLQLNGGSQTETIALPDLKAGVYYFMVDGRAIPFIKK
jgi:hypothetical protein